MPTHASHGLRSMRNHDAARPRRSRADQPPARGVQIPTPSARWVSRPYHGRNMSPCWAGTPAANAPRREREAQARSASPALPAAARGAARLPISAANTASPMPIGKPIENSPGGRPSDASPAARDRGQSANRRARPGSTIVTQAGERDQRELRSHAPGDGRRGQPARPPRVRTAAAARRSSPPRTGSRPPPGRRTACRSRISATARSSATRSAPSTPAANGPSATAVSASQ